LGLPPRSSNSRSSNVVVALPSARSTMVRAGWVVVLTLVLFALHAPVLTLQVPPRPHWESIVQTPGTVTTPSGPSGLAQVLVT
jgi:hypothetical protein